MESDQKHCHPLTEASSGEYVSPGLNLNAAHKYYLYVKTTDGKEYASDPEPVIPDPPIDSIGYTVQSSGIQLYLNTHNPHNTTRYYRWEYNETWQFHAEYNTPYITDGNKLNYRTQAQQINGCFGNNASTTILLGSSANLSSDVIYQSPLTQLSSTSEKLETKYTILVKQYGLTPEAFNFWQNLKKNTQTIGSIFDAQPSEIQGNIHCITTPSVPVLGYISVTTVQQKRIFISNDELPRQWLAAYPYQCRIDTFLFDDHFTNDVAMWLLPQPPHYFAIDPIGASGFIAGYIGVSAECADCTIRGTTKQPDFWR